MRCNAATSRAKFSYGEEVVGWPIHVGSSKNMKIGLVSGARGSRGDDTTLEIASHYQTK